MAQQSDPVPKTRVESGVEVEVVVQISDCICAEAPFTDVEHPCEDQVADQADPHVPCILFVGCPREKVDAYAIGKHVEIGDEVLDVKDICPYTPTKDVPDSEEVRLRTPHDVMGEYDQHPGPCVLCEADVDPPGAEPFPLAVVTPIAPRVIKA